MGEENPVVERMKEYVGERRFYDMKNLDNHAEKIGRRLAEMAEIKHGELIKYNNLGEF